MQAISTVTGIPVTPDYGTQLRLAALNQNLQMSGIVSFLLRIYPYITQVTTISAAVAAFGLLLLILVMLIKPLLSILLLAAVVAIIYFGSQGYLGQEVGDYVAMILGYLKNFFDQIVSFVNETKLMDTINNLVNQVTP